MRKWTNLEHLGTIIDQSRAARLLPGFVLMGFLWWLLNGKSLTYGIWLLNWQINDSLQRSAGMDGNGRPEPTEEIAARRSVMARCLGVASLGTVYWWEISFNEYKWLVAGAWLVLSLIVCYRIHRSQKPPFVGGR